MNTGGDAAEQVIRLSLNGVEVAAKVTGAAAKHIAILLYTILKDQSQNKQASKKGKASLDSMMRSGKALTMFTVRNSDLEKFTEAAKKYGVVYCALTDKNNKDPNAQVDIITKAECAPMINRIIERYGLASVNEKDDILSKEMSEKETVVPQTKATKSQDKQDTEQLLDDLLGKSQRLKEPTTEKSLPSKNTSDTPTKSEKDTTKSNQKPSVKKELQTIRENRKKQVQVKAPKVPTMKKSNEAR